MIDDLPGYGPDAELEADVCVVGAGAAGIAIARELADSKLSVLLVESGGLEPDPATDELKRGEEQGLTPGGLVEGRGRAFGGTTSLWAGQCIPLDPLDLERRDWIPHSGWPLDHSELSPHYERACAVLRVSGESFDETLWRRWGIEPPAIDAEKLRHTYTVWSPRPDLGRAFLAELRRSADVRVLLRANATAIEAGPAGDAFERLVVRGLDGSSARIRARACVLCCGGVENARLLLASGDAEAGGIGNSHGNVGRYFQEHPIKRTAVLRTGTPRPLQETYNMLYRRRRRYLPKLALTPAVQRGERVANCAANLEYDYVDEGLEALRRLIRGRRGAGGRGPVLREAGVAARDAPAIAASAYRRLARGRSSLAPPARIWLQVYAEQAPNPDSRVCLVRERDSLGSNRARVEWRTTSLEERTAEVMTGTVAAEFRRLGLAEAEPWSEGFGDAYHHMGATRMTDDPRNGVVDRDCRVHGVAGLYVAGSSVFPTSGFGGPTLTIVALALRLADHLRTALR